MQRAATGTLLTLVAILALACGPRVAHAQTLSFAYAKGDLYQYKLHETSDGTFNMSNFPESVKSDLTATESVTVHSVDPTGAADVTVSLTHIVGKADVKDPNHPSSTITTTMSVPDLQLKIAPDGRIISVNGMGGPGIVLAGTTGAPGLISAVLPDTAVKPGDTWTKNYDPGNSYGTGTIRITSQSKYLRDETVGAVNAAVVQTISSETFDATFDLSTLLGGPTPTPSVGGSQSPIGAMFGVITIKGTVDSDVTSWIDPSAHRVLKSRMSSNYDAKEGWGATDLPISVATKGKQTQTLDPA